MRLPNGQGRHWLRDGLVVAEIALALVLVTGGSLMIRTIRNLSRVSVGFDSRQILTLHLSMPPASLLTGDSNGATICIVTHDPRYVSYADRSIHLFDGRVVDESAKQR